MASITLRSVTGSSSGATTKGSALTITELDNNFDNLNLLKLEIPSSNGIVSRTGTNVTVGRTITGTGSNISVTNGDGVSGNPTIDVGANVALLNTGATFSGAVSGTSLAVAGTTVVNSNRDLTNFRGMTETVFTITDGAAVDINPANGTLQTWVLGAARTPTATSFAAGQSVTLMISGTASGFQVTWTTIGVIWVGGTAPTLLSTTGYGIIQLWKVGSTVYGSYGGAVA